MDKVKFTAEQLLRTKCSYLPYIGAKTNRPKCLSEILFELPEREPMRGRIHACREAATVEAETGIDNGNSTRLKKGLPIWFPSGIYDGNGAKKDIRSFSCLMSLDLDGKDNPGLSVNEMKFALSNFPFVAYAGMSSRGRGVFALVFIPEDGRNPDRYSGYWHSVKTVLERNGLKVDRATGNVNRGRFLSSDPSAYIAKVSERWETWSKPITPSHPLFDISNDVTDSRDYKRVLSIVEQCEERGKYLFETGRDWFICGRCLAGHFGEDGRSLFLRFSDVWSTVTGQRQKEDPSRKYDYCLNLPGNTCGLGFVFSRAKENGIIAKMW